MPLVWVRPFDGRGYLGIWEITEELEELRRSFRGSDEDIAEFEQIHHPQKQREFLASRILVRTLVETAGETYRGILKDPFDKPFLKGTTHQFSLSHSLRYAAAVWHPSAFVGLDIEPVHEKLQVVAHKFLSEDEYRHANGNLRQLAVYWTAKEALYKLHGKKKLSFKKNLPVDPFPEDCTLIRGWIRTEHGSRAYELEVHTVADCMLTVTAEKDS
ncbi:4'-phosphopantetheinyl transferase family protein [Siphonobacter aquaeclarae]|uniref:4'-phosphopantetheinyl transferase superfamily protein n=1 Tax=Siphonobacter aquaeclarae TaxID=563176 RepID=A0A1G9UAH9_9BACT|nr:4'-phosphopantetheinyl transferase superfamily protein [Siphonobacter aquaeclarae]SDM56986.1 4'-phosphopantetheinyl transferase superfamily protein [Siphonobacter aquaeclarae]